RCCIASVLQSKAQQEASVARRHVAGIAAFVVVDKDLSEFAGVEPAKTHAVEKTGMLDRERLAETSIFQPASHAHAAAPGSGSRRRGNFKSRMMCPSGSRMAITAGLAFARRNAQVVALLGIGVPDAEGFGGVRPEPGAITLLAAGNSIMFHRSTAFLVTG